MGPLVLDANSPSCHQTEPDGGICRVRVLNTTKDRSVSDVRVSLVSLWPQGAQSLPHLLKPMRGKYPIEIHPGEEVFFEVAKYSSDRHQGAHNEFMLGYYVDEANPPRPNRVIVQPYQLVIRVTAQNCPMIEKSFHLSRTNNRPIVIPLP